MLKNVKIERSERIDEYFCTIKRGMLYSNG